MRFAATPCDENLLVLKKFETVWIVTPRVFLAVVGK
jgi:hypothetical protein